MAIVRGCHFPDELFYDVPHHVWYRREADGLVRLGITVVGVAMAREVLIFTPKRVGRPFEGGRAVATVESAKWVGSVRSAFPGAIEAINEGLAGRASQINRDCYGAGWMMLVRPKDQAWSDRLVTGEAIAAAYENWMEANGFEGCGEGA